VLGWAVLGGAMPIMVPRKRRSGVDPDAGAGAAKPTTV
jgi:hypothetical protein